MSATSVVDRSIHRLRKIRYIVKNATVTALINPVSTTMIMFAKVFISAKTVIKLY